PSSPTRPWRPLRRLPAPNKRRLRSRGRIAAFRPVVLTRWDQSKADVGCRQGIPMVPLPRPGRAVGTEFVGAEESIAIDVQGLEAIVEVTGGGGLVRSDKAVAVGVHRLKRLPLQGFRFACGRVRVPG